MKAASWRVASGYESIPAPTTTTSPFFFLLETTDPLNRSPDTWPQDRADWTTRCTVPVRIKRLDEIQHMRKPVRKRLGLCICVCL